MFFAAPKGPLLPSVVLEESVVLYIELDAIYKTKVHINKLKESGLIQRIGPDKGGFWQILTSSQKPDDK